MGEKPRKKKRKRREEKFPDYDLKHVTLEDIKDLMDSALIIRSQPHNARMRDIMANDLCAKLALEHLGLPKVLEMRIRERLVESLTRHKKGEITSDELNTESDDILMQNLGRTVAKRFYRRYDYLASEINKGFQKEAHA